MLEMPMEVKAIFDNGGNTIDRYSAVICFEDENGPIYEAPNFLTMSENPSHPRGVSIFGQGDWEPDCEYEICLMGADDCEGCEYFEERLGRRVSWNELSENIQQHIIDRIANMEGE